MSSSPTDTLLEIDDPDDIDAMIEIIKDQIARIRTITPARVLSYDPVTERATVQPILRGRFVDQVEEQLVTYRPAPLSARPVLWLSAGELGMTGELVKDQEVTLLISDRSIAEWLQTAGADVTPADLRRFDLSDAMILPTRVRPGPATRYAAGSLFLGHRSAGGAGLRVTSTTVALGTPAVEVLDQVQQALAAVASLPTALALLAAELAILGTSPLTAATLLATLETAGLGAADMTPLAAQINTIRAAINSIRGTP
jgi:hypothetical protein